MEMSWKRRHLLLKMNAEASWIPMEIIFIIILNPRHLMKIIIHMVMVGYYQQLESIR